MIFLLWRKNTVGQKNWKLQLIQTNIHQDILKVPTLRSILKKIYVWRMLDYQFMLYQMLHSLYNIRLVQSPLILWHRRWNNLESIFFDFKNMQSKWHVYEWCSLWVFWEQMRTGRTFYSFKVLGKTAWESFHQTHSWFLL